jgi:hypothetical protein
MFPRQDVLAASAMGARAAMTCRQRRLVPLAIRTSPKERAAHRACVKENAPGAGVETQQSRFNDNLMRRPPEAAYLLSGRAMHKPISITHHGATINVYLT